MKAVQREDFDGLAKLLIKAGHLFNLLWVRHKAGVQLLIASVNIGDHQHHELHRSSPWFLFWSCTPSRLAAPKFDTHPNYFFRAPGAAVLNTAAPVLVGSCQGPTPRRRATSVRASASTPSTSSSRRASASRPSPTWTRTRRS